MELAGLRQGVCVSPLYGIRVPWRQVTRIPSYTCKQETIPENGGSVVRFLARVIWIGWCWTELAVLTAFLYVLSFLPKAW
jgi:hypothetical protein